MKIKIPIMISVLLIQTFISQSLEAQAIVWTLRDCIAQALKQNTEVNKSGLTNDINRVNSLKARAARYPSLSASVGQDFSLGRSLNGGIYSKYSGSTGMDCSLSSSLTVYNWGKTGNGIEQSDLNCQAGQYDLSAIKESISLSVLNFYLQVLYSEEQVTNSKRQIEATEGQLSQAGERMKIGTISKADYLQVKSELANEKLTLAKAESLLSSNRVGLMQLMELPVSAGFKIERPSLEKFCRRAAVINPDSLYAKALEIKPQIESARLNVQAARLNEKIAKADYYPTLSLTSGISTGYSSSGGAYGYQVKNKITPSVGLNLSVPIYQNRQAESKDEIAKIGTLAAELSQRETKSQLRKAIEQACSDAVSADREYEAGIEGYNSSLESYQVSSEKFNQGLINSVDFISAKTSFITAESKLLQGKYSLIFNYKTLDFYSGIPLTL